MFAMSVNDVPGWLVTMPPRAMGVPVAATPGLVPQELVLTLEVPEGLVFIWVLALGPALVLVLLVVLLLVLLHPAAAMATAAAAVAARTRVLRLVI